ncbi:MAG: stage II sporulation protein P [Defluviitaleaceae bacterium]|nr:stage II sporulation protein P [Defluviitaleaceae bacterium]
MFDIIKNVLEKIKKIKDLKEKLIIGILLKVLATLIFPLIFNFFTVENNEDNKEYNILDKENFIPTFKNINHIVTLEDIKKHIFYIDNTAYVRIEDFPIDELLNIDLRINLYGESPRILITHTHSQEYFIDSEEGNEADSIVAVGRYLANIFTNNGINVVHDTSIYDVVDGKLARATSYERAEAGIRRILEEHEDIEVLIDLHRDASDTKLVTEINGAETAQIMFFNGITRRNIDGEAVDLYDFFNPYIKENLALSLQMFLTANEYYPNFVRKNYIKAYRYSLHILPRSMLVEVGANTSTLEEAKNAMYPLARIIMSVLSLN